MSLGTSSNGKSIQANDQVTIMAVVTSVSAPNVTVKLAGSGNSITAAQSNFNGGNESGAGKTLAVAGDSVSAAAVVSSISGTGQVASLTVKLNDGTSATVQGQDVYVAMTL